MRARLVDSGRDLVQSFQICSYRAQCGHTLGRIEPTFGRIGPHLGRTERQSLAEPRTCLKKSQRIVEPNRLNPTRIGPHPARIRSAPAITPPGHTQGLGGAVFDGHS